LGNLYDKLDRAGAIGMVYTNEIVFAFPGSESFVFENTNRCEFCDRKLLLVQFDKQIIHFLPEMRKSTNLFIHVSPPQTSRFVTLYESLLWTLPMRTLLPMLSLATSSLAFAEVYRVLRLITTGSNGRNDHSARKISLVVCGVEALSMLLFGIALALGLYGPSVISVHVLYGAFSMFIGCGTFVTLVLGLFLREERLSMCSPGHIKRDILIQYRAVLLVFSFILVVPDVFGILMSLLFLYSNQR
jgi:hypothetical protein